MEDGTGPPRKLLRGGAAEVEEARQPAGGARGRPGAQEGEAEVAGGAGQRGEGEAAAGGWRRRREAGGAKVDH